jgi:non-heme chloroperoxidase
LPDFPHGHAQHDIDAWIDAIRADRLGWCAGFARSLFHAEPREHVQRWFFDQAARVPLRAVLETIADARRSDHRPALARVDCPTAVFHGRHDALDFLAAGEYLRDHIRGARLVLFEASGHAPHYEERARFNAELARFLDAGR